MHLQPSSRQGELIALARRLACERFAPRADRHDRAASFPFDDYADLRAEGLLGLCVPERYGGLGADYETYCLVAEQLAQGNASTALTFNMSRQHGHNLRKSATFVVDFQSAQHVECCCVSCRTIDELPFTSGMLPKGEIVARHPLRRHRLLLVPPATAAMPPSAGPGLVLAQDV